jgi:hypothetical protein
MIFLSQREPHTLKACVHIHTYTHIFILSSSIRRDVVYEKGGEEGERGEGEGEGRKKEVWVEGKEV